MRINNLSITIGLFLSLFVYACARTKPSVVASPVVRKAYDETKYRPVVDTLKKLYTKEKFLYDNKHGDSRYRFDFVPISLFPFFCLDSALFKNPEIIYIYGIDYSAFIVTDKYQQEYLKIGTVSYIQGIGAPTTKTYRLHSFFYDTYTKIWKQDGAPYEIYLDLTNVKDQFYGCRSIKKKVSN